jgi:hypothetical protein
MKTYIEEFLTTFSGFHQMIFRFLTAYNLQQLFPQLTAHSNFFHSHSPTKQTLSKPSFWFDQPLSYLISMAYSSMYSFLHLSMFLVVSHPWLIFWFLWPSIVQAWCLSFTCYSSLKQNHIIFIFVIDHYLCTPRLHTKPRNISHIPWLTVS